MSVPSARDQLYGAIRIAATYASDEGTCGWLLTETQFDAIFAAADAYAAAQAAAAVAGPLTESGTT